MRILKVVGVVGVAVGAVLAGAIRLAPYLREHVVTLRQWRQESVRERIDSHHRRAVEASRVRRS